MNITLADLAKLDPEGNWVLDPVYPTLWKDKRDPHSIPVSMEQMLRTILTGTKEDFHAALERAIQRTELVVTSTGWIKEGEDKA